MVIGNGGLIDRKIINRTIPLYVPPFANYVPGFFHSKVEEKVKEAKNLIEEFWKNDLSKVQKCYDNFPRPEWLKNQDEQLWLPILAPSKAYSDLLDQPTHFEQMLALAKKIVTSRRMQESAIPLEQKVLEATLAFMEKHNPMKERKSNSEDAFYYGPDLFDFINTILDQPDLRKERITEILNNHGVVKDTWRPRFTVTDEKKSKGNKKVEKTIQPTCYALDKDQLSKALET